MLISANEDGICCYGFNKGITEDEIKIIWSY
jgi:hypothetical protein